MTKKKRNNDKDSQPYYEGLEIGAVSVKWVRRTHKGDVTFEVMQHGGNPLKVIREIIDRSATENNSRIVVSGQAAKIHLNLPYHSETECLEKALEYHNLKPDILLSLGGETFSVYPMKDGKVKNIIATTKCAAGTGEFIVQQFKRMGLSLEEGLEASLQGEKIQLATRCSVHCKSDATHKLNKGECTTGDVAKTLINDLAKKVSDMVEVAQWDTKTIVISGGVAQNKPFVEHFRQFFKESDVIVLPESPYLEAFGASLYASELPETFVMPPSQEWLRTSNIHFDVLKPLKEAEPLLDYRVKADTEKVIVEGASYILGVDAGSTTTKAVLFNVSDGSVGASCYLRTLGNPILATKQCLEAIIQHVGDKSIKIIQAGVTGSAREMVSVYLDNCITYNEILAHARSAAEDVPGVDTVFEIGGQDSKFISFLKGVPIDYAMNEGCSAGTGSFLEESASVDMGVATEEISGIAESSAHPIAFGERCAAFINTDLRNALQQGASREDVIAGLVYSIADNYTSRIVGARHLGEPLLFLGGVALNKAVALAMAARTQRKVIVPPHPELMGSVGTALMLRDHLRSGYISEREYDLHQLIQGEMELKDTFRCKACENNCEIQRIAIRGKVYPFGGLCSKYEILRHRGDETKEGRDMVALRNNMMINEFGPQPVKNPRGTIGLPMALTTFELFPFYTKLINELGYDVVTSSPSKVGNSKAIAAICYPCEVVHGAVYDLMNRNVDYIFLPSVIELEVPEGSLRSFTCPSTTVIADVIRAAFRDITNKILSPHISLSKDHIKTTLQEIERMGTTLGLHKGVARKAGEKALSHYEEYIKKYRELGEKEFEELIKEPTVIIVGRPYNTCSAEVNLALPRKITSKGYSVISADMLPHTNHNIHERDVWHFTQQISNAVGYAKKYPNLYICLVSCFSCGPDASMYHWIRQELEGRTFCYLEIDSHTAHAGFETRVGAFLDIVEERRRKKEDLNLN